MDKLKKDILKTKTDSEHFAEVKTRDLLRAYKRNLDDVQKQIAQIYMKYTVDVELKISARQRYNVLLQLEKQLAGQLKDLGETNVNTTTNILAEVYEDTYYKTAYSIHSNVSAQANFALLRPETVQAAIARPINGKSFSDRIWKNTNALAKRVKTDIEKAMIQGLSVEKLARQIKKDFGSSAYAAQRLINTEVAKSMTLASKEIYKNSGVITTVLFDATLDGKTSDVCQSLDGKEFPLDNHPPIPQHPNCRSAILPVVNGWKPTTKATKNPDGTYEDIPYMNYPKWKTYTVAKQHEPIITKDLKSVVSKTGSKLQGLEFKLKTEESYIRKVKYDMLSGRTEKDVLKSTYDIVRYTNVSSIEDFTDNFHDCRFVNDVLQN